MEGMERNRPSAGCRYLVLVLLLTLPLWGACRCGAGLSLLEPGGPWDGGSGARDGGDTEHPLESVDGGAPKEAGLEPLADGGAEDAGVTGDGAGRPEGKDSAGFLVLTFYPSEMSGGVGSFSAYAIFFDKLEEGGLPFTELRDGECNLSVPEQASEVRGEDRGEGLTLIRPDNSKTLLKREKQPFGFWYVSETVQELSFPFGKAFTLSGGGGGHPAFVISVPSPSRLTLLSPQIDSTKPYVLKLNQGLELRWKMDGATKYVVARIVQPPVGEPPTRKRLTCRFANTGAATVPAGWLMKLAPTGGTKPPLPERLSQLFLFSGAYGAAKLSGSKGRLYLANEAIWRADLALE